MKNLHIQLIAIIVILLSVIGGGSYYFLDKDHDNSEVTSDNTAVATTSTSSLEQATTSEIKTSPLAVNAAIKTTTTTNNTYIAPRPSTNTKSILFPNTLKIESPSSNIHTEVGQKISISYSVTSNIVANDPAVVERKIVKAGTDTNISTYISVPVSNGNYSFEWTGDQAGKYQALLSIAYNNKIYLARSAVITVGDGGTVTPLPDTTPSITFKSISSGNFIGSFTNLPANSQIRFVNATTGEPFYETSSMAWSGGNGQLSIPIPNNLPNGKYYLRVTDYYNPSTTIAQTVSFQIDTNI